MARAAGGSTRFEVTFLGPEECISNPFSKAAKAGHAPKDSKLIVLAMACGLAAAQEVETKPVTVGQPMPDFTLPAYQGGTVTLSALKGKNVMIIFPRGYAAENAWCTICNEVLNGTR